MRFRFFYLKQKIIAGFRKDYLIPINIFSNICDFMIGRIILEFSKNSDDPIRFLSVVANISFDQSVWDK